MGVNVRSICLPKTDENLSAPGEIVKVAGWGFTAKDPGRHSSVLLYSAFKIQNKKTCKDTTRYLFNETVMFCAGHDKGGNDTCKGDSGGSTVREVLRNGRRRWVTVGLVSWGVGCGIKGKYGYYTKMEPFVNWIQKKINGSILSCGDPGNIANGRIDGSDFLVGFTVKYKCNEGYMLRGRSRSRCKRNGKWTKAPTCKKVECKDPGRPRYGIRRQKKKKYYSKDKIKFRCKTNYTIIGRSTMVCRSDGTWSGIKPACLAPCKDPGIPKGGVRLDHSFKHSQTVRFLCRKKNQPPSVAYLTCTNGRWNQNIPRCIADCDDPGVPTNGQRQGNDFTLKKRVFFTCHQGYMRVGPQYLQCQSNRQWSDKTPICEALSCTRPIPPDNAYIFSRGQLKEKYRFNEVVMFHCNKGHLSYGSLFVKCLAYGWSTSNQLRCLPKNCGDPGTPSNGRRQGNAFTFNNKVNYTCDAVGYEMKGSVQRVCQENGKWSGTRTTCERVECKNPVKLIKGVRRPDKSKYVYEDRIEFKCNTNHTRMGKQFIICQHDRTWTGTVPRCLAPCRDPGIPIGGQRYQHSFLHNSIVQFRCKQGWTREGSHTIKCTDGRWDYNPPICNKGCSKPNEDPAHGGIYYSSKQYYNHKTSIRYYCHGGYDRIGQEYVRCLNGTWENRQPTCKPVECRNPGRPANGGRNPDKNKYIYQDRIQFQCKKNYTMTGSSFIICQANKRWSGNVPRCLAPCTDPGIPIGGYRYQHSFLHGRAVQFRCKQGWTMDGFRELTCTNGRWNHDPPICNKGCSRPNEYPSHGGISGSSTHYTHKTSIRYYCHIGYDRIGQEYVRCLNGTWENRQPTCRPVECRDPGRPLNGGRRPDKNKYIYQDSIGFQCNTNYTRKGSSSITCRANKRWSGNVPRCLAPCRDPGIPSNAQRLDHSFLHNDRVRFSCQSGWNIEGSATIRCNNGNWDHPTPQCMECGTALGMESRKIPDGNIQASSTRYRYHAKYGRLNGRYAWCSGTARDPYLQIDFGKPYRITGLATQGSAYDNKWVERYTVRSNLAGSSFNMYREDNRDKIFIGNRDKGSVVKNKLRHPVVARRLRIYPRKQGGFSSLSRACMRVEIYGCDLPSDCVLVGSRVVAKWTSYQKGDSKTYIYYKAYLTSISRYWQVKLENENRNRDAEKYFLKYGYLPFVLDVPPRHEELQVGSRVLAPWGYRFYTGTIKTGRDSYNKYRVRADDGDEKDCTVDQIRLLKAPSFCN